MERPTKLQLVLTPPAWLARDDFRHTVLDRVAPRLAERAGCAALKVTLTSGSLPPRLSPIPFRRESVALLSLSFEGAPSPDVPRLAAFAGWRLDGYRVSESRPVAYERDWPVGEQTPGVGMLTLFRRRRGLDDRTFIERWHGSHTPLSLEIHPLWSYVRNVVEATETAAAPPWDGIVEEHFRHRRDLLSPVRFFGGAARMLPNMLRVAYDVSRFIDLVTLRTYLVDEVQVVV